METLKLFLQLVSILNEIICSKIMHKRTKKPIVKFFDSSKIKANGHFNFEWRNL